MPQPNVMTSEQFRTEHLQTLEAGDVAFHGQLFPKPYPTDLEEHKVLKADHALTEAMKERFDPYLAFLAMQDAQGVKMQRLRTLPAEMNGNVEAMVRLCEVTAVSEEVRVTLFEPQLGRLALSRAPQRMVNTLAAPVPRGGLWSARRQGFSKKQAAVIGLMDYSTKGEFQGVELHRSPSAGLLAYEKFWHNVFTSNRHSVPLDQWRQLYD